MHWTGMSMAVKSMNLVIPACVAIFNSKNVVLVWWSLWFTQVPGITTVTFQ